MSTRIAEYEVTGMSCGHCENAIKSELSSVPGIAEVDVSASTGVLRVTFTDDAQVPADVEIQNSAVIAAVDEAGYSATLRVQV